MADENKKYKEAIDLTATLNKQIKKINEGFSKGGEAHKKQLDIYKTVVTESMKAVEAGNMSEASLKRRITLVTSLSDKTKDVKELSIKSRDLDKEATEHLRMAQKAEDAGLHRAAKRQRILAKEAITNKGTNDIARDALAVETKKEERTKVIDKLTGGLFGKHKEIKKVLEEQGKKEGTKILAWISVGAVIAIAVKALTGFSKKIDEIGQTFGVLASDTQFTENIITAEHAAIALGKGMGDVLSTMGSLSSEFGIALGEASKLSGKILDTAMATGLSNDEATKLFGSFMQIGGLSKEATENLTESTFQLAKSKGVNPSQALKDIASSTETMATFSKGTSENLFEAAVAARQLGLNIDTIAKSARGMLNFQESLNAEIEASLMLGKDLDFSKARELALNKDIAGFQDEIKRQLGDIGDFRELDVFQQESLAKALNMSVVETAKLVSGTEKLSLAGALSAGNFEDLAGEDALSNLSKMINKFKELGATLLDKLGKPLSDAVGALYDLFTEAENLTWMEEKIGGIAGFFKGLPDMISSTWNKLKLGIAIMVGLKTATMGYALASAAAMAFKMGSVSFGVGAGIALAGIIATFATLAAIPSFQDKAPSQIAMVGHQDGTFGNEAIITPDPIVAAIESLREDMKGLGEQVGIASGKQMGKEFRTMKSGI